MKVKVNEGCLGCKAKELTDKPFGVNIMLMSPYADEVAKVIVEETEDPAVQDAIDGCPVGVIEAE